jgi:hypothetical protein
MIMPGLVFAATASERQGPNVFAGIEYFSWEEFGNTGPSLLKESGSRLTLGAVARNFEQPFHRIVYEVEVKGYFGDVGYDGQTQSGQPLETDTEYRGTRLDVTIGGRVMRLWDSYHIDLLGGLGVEDWTRNIKDGETSSGTPVFGIKETYHVRYGQVGIGLFDGAHNGDNYLRIGARKPLDIRQGVSIFDGPAVLEPQGEWAMFIRYRAALDRPSSRYRRALTFYYDSYRLSQSPIISTTIGGTPSLVFQPRSTMDVFGVQFETSF